MKKLSPFAAGMISFLLFSAGVYAVYLYMSRDTAWSAENNLSEIRAGENKLIQVILLITCLISLVFNFIATYNHFQANKNWFHHLRLFAFLLPLMILQSSGLYLLGVFNLLW